MEIVQNADLKPYNTFGITAKAKWFTSVKNENELVDILNNSNFINEHKMALGGGSNILLTQDVNGLVIKLDLHGIELIEETEGHYKVAVGAGENWHNFVMTCVKNNWAGVENMALIPGNVGAAPMQNIGAYGMEVRQVIDSVRAYLPHENTFIDLTNEACNFDYRSSIFKTELKGKAYITRVIFKLPKKHCINTSYGAIETELENKGIENPSLMDVSNAVIAIRQSKLPDPKEIGNAGSFFKNPVVDIEIAKKVLSKYPDAPHYPAPVNQIKFPAGWLIETAGWKGKSFDNSFGVHKKQALVLVNYKNATGKQIYDLSQNILEDIESRFGILLEREVNII
jgi:UDP-N-acetylmuramate dehydrogenase